MTPPEASPLPSADEPLEDADFALLDDIRELFQAADPMPADLPERIRFSLALRDLEIEVARLAEEEQLTVAAELGMAVGSVGPTRGRCLAKLRALLADDPEGSLR